MIKNHRLGAGNPVGTFDTLGEAVGVGVSVGAEEGKKLLVGLGVGEALALGLDRIVANVGDAVVVL